MPKLSPETSGAGVPLFRVAPLAKGQEKRVKCRGYNSQK